MESNVAMNLQERIDLALANIEAIESEAISFKNTKKELQELSSDFLNYLSIQKDYLLNLKELVKDVRSSLVEDTLAKFETSNLKLQELLESNQKVWHENINQEVNSFKEEISELKINLTRDYKEISKSQSKLIISFGIITFVIVATSILLNIFVF